MHTLEDQVMLYSKNHPPLLSLTPGPVPVYPQVLHAMSRPVLYDYDDPYQALYSRLIDKLQVALRSRGRPMILQGEPVLALQAAAASLIAPGDKVLNLVSGPYGKGFADWVRRADADLLEIEVPDNQAIDPQSVADFLTKHPDITVVAVCHHETPCGTINPINEIGALVAAHGAHFIVDAVSSFAGMDTHPDDCHAAIYVTGPAKCLGAPPALSIVAVGKMGWKKIEANPTAPRNSVLSLLDWKQAGQNERKFPFTTSIADINGLDAALDLYLEEGPQQVWHRHCLTASAFRAGVAAMGLSIWALNEKIASPTTTVVRLPSGIADTDLIALMRSRYGVLVSAGRGPTAGKAIRVGHMGPAAHPLHAISALVALADGLSMLGNEIAIGDVIQVAMRVINQST